MVAILGSDRGIPLASLILVGFCGLFAFVTTRTPSAAISCDRRQRGGDAAGRHPHKRVKIAVFTIASTMAAAGGI